MSKRVMITPSTGPIENYGGTRLEREEWCPDSYDAPAAEHEMPCRRCRDLGEELAQLQAYIHTLEKALAEVGS